MTKTDSEILWQCYEKLAEKCARRNKKKVCSGDNTLAAGLFSSTVKQLAYLRDFSDLPADELQKHLIRAKGLFLQYSCISSRNPSCISSSFSQKMKELIKAVCLREAEMIDLFRLQQTGGERIDIREIFAVKKNLNLLAGTPARTIVSNAVSAMPKESEPQRVYYITPSGKRFHRADCPFCIGRSLSPVSRAMAENLKLTPCRCLDASRDLRPIDRSWVTAFVDESIHPAPAEIICGQMQTPSAAKNQAAGQAQAAALEETDRAHRSARTMSPQSKAGSYSYILCWGNLECEKEISDRRLIAQGVDFIGEHEHIERLTEAAIGKVLLSLLYDYEFSGNVRIYTDNLGAVNHWNTVGSSSRLAREFCSVKVCHIPRKENRQADHLCRSRVLLDMSAAAYRALMKRAGQGDQ